MFDLSEEEILEQYGSMETCEFYEDLAEYHSNMVKYIDDMTDLIEQSEPYKKSPKEFKEGLAILKEFGDKLQNYCWPVIKL